MGPRVLVDATAIPADRAGAGRYVDELLRALSGMGTDLAIACQRADAGHYHGMAPDADRVAGPALISRRPVRLAWEQVALPGLVRRRGADVLHSPHYTMPLGVRRPVVVTLHDVTFFTQPETHTRVKGPFFRAAIKTALHRAARCIVPSRATRDELVRVLDADPTRIDVAYLGVDRDVFHVPTDAEKRRVQSSLGLDGRSYVAFLSTLQPRKNVPGLIRGWAAVRDRDDPPALVLAGGAGWDDTIDAAIAGVPRHLQVLRPGYLPLEDLRGLLGGAVAVAYPSLGEGFGIPVLEGMACGAPVLTTRRLSLPEVVTLWRIRNLTRSRSPRVWRLCSMTMSVELSWRRLGQSGLPSSLGPPAPRRISPATRARRDLRRVGLTLAFDCVRLSDTCTR